MCCCLNPGEAESLQNLTPTCYGTARHHDRQDYQLECCHTFALEYHRERAKDPCISSNIAHSMFDAARGVRGDADQTLITAVAVAVARLYS